MTALDFPSNPTPGQVFDRWSWDGTKWMLAGGGSGGVTMPHGRVESSAVQSFVHATSTDAAFGTDIVGPAGWGAAQKLNILESGDYVIEARLAFAAAEGVVLLVLDHRDSAGVRKRVVDYVKATTTAANGDVYLSTAGMISAVAGDTVAVSVTQTQTTGTAARPSVYIAGAIANSLTWRKIAAAVDSVKATTLPYWLAGIGDAGVLVQGGAGSTIDAPRYLETVGAYRSPGAPMRKNSNVGVVVEMDGVYRVSFSIKYGIAQYAFFGLEHVRASARLATYLAEVNMTAAVLAGQPGASGKIAGYAHRERIISMQAGDILRPIGYAPSFGYDAALITVGGGDSIMEVVRIADAVEVSP